MESNGVGGGQVRRVNLVYFLSRSGHVDHPHLLRVHHLSRNGVFLRDVKRWLANARGDAMPDTFSWSCKRRYKNGYVWQDLLDDDLITPISDNEYVLKGSEILLNSPKEDCLLTEKKAWGTRKSVNIPEENFQKPKIKSEKILKESPVFCSATTSTITEESTTSNDEKKQVSGGSNETGSGQDVESGRPSVSSTMSSSSYTKSNKSYTSVRASNVLRNLMKCGGLDTNDAVLVPLNKSRSEAFGPAWENERKHNARKSYEGRTWSGIKMKETLEFCEPKVNSSMVAPSCSQCGKLFKPEKMLTHMKLCQGMKHSSAMIGNNISKPRQQRCTNIS